MMSRGKGDKFTISSRSNKQMVVMQCSHSPKLMASSMFGSMSRNSTTYRLNGVYSIFCVDKCVAIPTFSSRCVWSCSS